MAVYVLICRGRRPDRTGIAETQAQVIAYFIHKKKKKNGGKAFQYWNTVAQRPPFSAGILKSKEKETKSEQNE